MNSQHVTLGICRFEVLTEGEVFLGLGKIWIGRTLVRSGRLPLRVWTQSFTGHELARLTLLRVEPARRQVRLRLRAEFRPAMIKPMRDHSFDPIHELGDWDTDRVSGRGELDLVLEPARDRFRGVAFEGFSYRWEYRSREVPLYYLYDMASWELDGDITGATVVSQSSCSAPVVKFDQQTAWSTEGILFFLVEEGNQNPVMTHNLPRWASHGSFDFQYKGDVTLIGVFERVELIRSVVCREAGKPELKHFDKHIFDQTLHYATSAKRILLNPQRKSEVDQQNLWTWIHCEVEERARQEHGLSEEPFIPVLAHNYWENFTVDTYYRDLLPAAAHLGFRQVFVDNLKKSAMTDETPHPGKFHWNMCCAHEYEIAPELGGVDGVRRFVERARELGVRVQSWTNNMQALSSPLNQIERPNKGWVLLEDARQKYGGAYMSCQSAFDLGEKSNRDYFIRSHIAIRDQTGLNCWLFDSFYNLAFMPINYQGLRPRTMWRQLLQMIQYLQTQDIHFVIESFGPFGRPQHGHPSSYNLQTIFACYRVGIGNDYTTVPTQRALKDITPRSAEGLYYMLAHMAYTGAPLFVDGKRLDALWTEAHKRALADYHAVLPTLHHRILQQDGLGVEWRDRRGRVGTLFNFKARRRPLPGTVMDITTGQKLPRAKTYALEPCHTYQFTTGTRPLSPSS